MLRRFAIFRRARRDGQRGAAISAAEASKAVAIIEAAYESARTGGAVRL